MPEMNSGTTYYLELPCFKYVEKVIEIWTFGYVVKFASQAEIQAESASEAPDSEARVANHVVKEDAEAMGEAEENH